MNEAANSVISPLVKRKCNPKVSPATPEEIAKWIVQIPAWTAISGALSRQFDFKDFHHTMSFVNAVAWIANSQDHHPDMAVSYNRCVVKFSTHSVDGLSENDFICAAKVDALDG